jgi:capsule polysaccharide export protein KpsE/RkpR
MARLTANANHEVNEQSVKPLGSLETLPEGTSRPRGLAILQLLLERRRFIFRTVGVGFLVSLLLAFLIPKRFESTARIMPPDNGSGPGLSLLAALTSGSGALGALSNEALGVKNTSALFVGILKSRTVEDRLIEKFDLRKRYRASRIEDARKELEEKTEISEDRKSGIVTITVTDWEPRQAQAMAQAFVEELNRLVAEVSTSAARRERMFLEERLKAVKQELDQAAREFSKFASENAAIDIKEQARAMVGAAATLQGQLIVAQTELEGLRQIYTDNNVRVRSVRARINELQHQIEKLGGALEDTAQNPRAEDRSSIPSIRRLPVLGVTFADLYRKTKVAEVVFELLTQQYELAKVQEAKEIPTVKVLDAPALPEKKIFPPRRQIVLLGSVLSFVFSILWIVGIARWQAMDPHDPKQTLLREAIDSVRIDAAWMREKGLQFRQKTAKLARKLLRRDREAESEKSAD